ncbi:MAG: alkaline phosphatase family protein [bacterium]
MFVFGMDGAAFPLVERWMAEGKLPALKTIAERGAFGVLRSTVPPITAAAWSTFMTGKNPGKTGVFDFTQVRRGTYDAFYTSAATIRGESLWGILSAEGKSVGVLNVPMTYPPEPVGGFLIGGIGVPDGSRDDYFHPAGLRSEIEQATGTPYRMHPGSAEGKDPYETFIEDAIRFQDERLKIIEYLLGSKRPEFFMVVFGETDSVAHYYWKYMDPTHPAYTPEGARKYGDAIERAYRKVDETIGRIMERVGSDDNYFFVVSDHGMGPFHFVPDYVNYYGRKGLLKLKMPVAKSEKAIGLLIVGHTFWRLSRQLFLWGRNALPWSVRNALNRLFPRSKKFVTTDYSLLNLLDWQRTKVFFPDPRNAGLLYINLKGREPAGIVEPADYEALRDEIQRDLESLTIPGTAVRVVEGVYKREDIYSGENLEEAPDLVIVWNTDATGLIKRDLSNVSAELRALFKPMDVIPQQAMERMPFSAFHTMQGILFATGPGIRPGQRLDAEISQIMPTLLALMKCAIPADVDGRVLETLFTADFAVSLKIQFRGPRGKREMPVYTPEEEAAVKERLRELGYLD